MRSLLKMVGYFPGGVGGTARAAWLRRSAKSCGRGVKVLPGSFIGSPSELNIGNDSAIGFGCYLGCFGGLSIGERVLMGPYVMIYTSNHIWNSQLGTYFRQGEECIPVVIEDDVWLGAGCVILPGVRIATGTTVAAGAVVTSDTMSRSVVAGIPAKRIKNLD